MKKPFLWCCMIFATAFAQSNGLSVLIIGDSNTENGLISLALADTLRNYFGVASMGTGYIPLNSSFYEIRDGRVTGVTIFYQTGSWTLMDMFEGTRLSAKPYLSPNGHWLKSSAANAAVAVTFPGSNGVDVYCLSDAGGGIFSVIVDNLTKFTVNTAGSRRVLKTPVTGLAPGNHTMQLKVLSVPASGNVTLLGFDSRNDLPGVTKRSVVHNWGNGYAATPDFLNIDSTVFASGLQELSPDIVVVLLGTNDHLQDSRSATEFKANLIAILNMIRAAGFAGRIMLVSTFMTNDASGANLIPQYRATSWPQAAAETGVAYWDMSTWFGAWNSALMMDGAHCNQAGGKKIAAEMLHQILVKFPSVSSADTRAGTLTNAPARPRYANGRLLVPVAGKGPFSVEITDLNGATVAEIFPVSIRKDFLDCGRIHLSAGTYMVEVWSNGDRSAWRVPAAK